MSDPTTSKLVDLERVDLERVEPQPSFPFGVARIVRVPDPWHPDAFAGTPAEGAVASTGPRRLTWQCEDAAGNLVAQWEAPPCPFDDEGEDADASVSVEWIHGAWHWARPWASVGAVHITAVCRTKGCCAQPLLFENESETWGDVLAFLRGRGWTVEVTEGRVTDAACPKCTKAAS